jgi:hypothetical protein
MHRAHSFWLFMAEIVGQLSELRDYFIVIDIDNRFNEGARYHCAELSRFLIVLDLRGEI